LYSDFAGAGSLISGVLRSAANAAACMTRDVASGPGRRLFLAAPSIYRLSDMAFARLYSAAARLWPLPFSGAMTFIFAAYCFRST
jgi:hypothetical protein